MIDYLNATAGGRFRHSEVSRKNIRARLDDGAVVDDCKLVIDHKAAQWLGDPEMEPHLNPETLFRPTKYEKNLSAAMKWHEQGRPPIGPRGARGVQNQMAQSGGEFLDALNARIKGAGVAT